MAMRSVTRLLVGIMPVTVAAAAVMFAAPTALASSTPPVLVFTVQPTTTQEQTAMTPTVTVEAENSSGTVVNSFKGQITLSYVPGTGTNPNAPPPTGATATASKGIATFPNLTFSAPGFSFALQASATGATTGASDKFDIVTQLAHCPPGQGCQSETVSSAGTSGLVAAGAASTNDVLAATGGGFPDLSCTSIGGVLTFTLTNRSKTITAMLAKNLVQQIGPGASHFNICWGSPVPFTTNNGTQATLQADGEYEGLLPDCSTGGPSPCIASQNKTNAGMEVTTVSAPAGDPRISY